MKKYICFAAALAIVGAASCNKELVDNNAPEIPEVKIATLTATIGEPDTKTTLAAPEGAHTSGSAVHWAAEDALSVFDGASNVKYTIKTEEDVDYAPAATAVFEGTELAAAEGYYALYPYTADATLADGVIKGAVLPATQTAVAGNIPAGAALAVAYTEDRSEIHFKNVATIIGFTLTEAAEKVVFVAKGGEAIAGTIDVTINEGLPTYTVQEETGINKVTLNNLEAGTYYFTILPDVTLAQGYEFYIGEELAKSKAEELTLVRSKVYSLGEVKVPLKDRELSFSSETVNVTYASDLDVDEPTLNGVNDGEAVTYTSSDAEVATVDASGVITVIKAGTVTIKATVAATDTHNEGSAEYTLTINKAERIISFKNKTLSGIVGAAFTAPDLDGVKDGESVIYTSSDESVATVNENGEVTLLAAGTTTITATIVEDDKYLKGEDQYTLTVEEKAVIRINNMNGWSDLNITIKSGSTTIVNEQPMINEGSNIFAYELEPQYVGKAVTYYIKHSWYQTSSKTITLVVDSKSTPIVLNTTYLQPGNDWNTDNPTFGAWIWGAGNGGIMVTAIKVIDNFYEIEIPTDKTCTGMKFLRCNPTSGTASWETKWNATADLTLKHMCFCNNAWDDAGDTRWY